MKKKYTVITGSLVLLLICIGSWIFFNAKSSSLKIFQVSFDVAKVKSQGLTFVSDKSETVLVKTPTIISTDSKIKGFSQEVLKGKQSLFSSSQQLVYDKDGKAQLLFADEDESDYFLKFPFPLKDGDKLLVKSIVEYENGHQEKKSQTIVIEASTPNK